MVEMLNVCVGGRLATKRTWGVHLGVGCDEERQKFTALRDKLFIGARIISEHSFVYTL